MLDKGRREFVALLGGAAAAWPLAARAQHGERAWRVGWIDAGAEGDDLSHRSRVAPVEALAALGWIEGRNLRIDRRFGAGDGNRIRSPKHSCRRPTR